MGFLKWLSEPVTEIIDKIIEERKLNEVDDNGILWVSNEDLDKPVLKTQTTKPNIFRPTSFKNYIGQKNAKNILNKFISGVSERNLIFPHTLIHGNAGCGKTTLVKIIANQLQVPIVETITSDIEDFEQLKSNINKTKGGILFLDEIHGIDRNNAEKLYTIMEDFSYGGIPVEQFTLIGATTELGEILKNRRPFYDRFKIIIGLEDYSTKDLTDIIIQYQKNIFPKDRLDNIIYPLIAMNSRNTPRTAIRLLEATIFFNGKIKDVLNSFDIIKNGYTKLDKKLLIYMKQNKTTIGVQSISSYLGTSEANYVFSIEPYLLQTGMIVRTPRGRLITELGKTLIKELEN